MDTITGFRITGLHGRRDINITIQGNAIVLVGVNGLGKTTIINLLYYLLTRQWFRLVEYQFEELALDIDGETLRLSRTQIEAAFKGVKWKRQLARFGPRIGRIVENSPELVALMASSTTGSAVLHTVVDKLHLPYAAIAELRMMLEDEPMQQELFASASEIKQFGEKIGALFTGQVLYLPTYRRIERDLEKIFPGMEEEIHRRRDTRPTQQSAYLEFVEFGMRDVERKFDEVLTGLKDRARTELNSLAASYLGEVIRGEADIYDTSLIASLDEGNIERILNRVEERDIIDASARDQLRQVISRLKRPESAVSSQEKYVGHFFSKLAAIHKSLADAEGAVEGFVKVCNGYLVGKSVVFDDRKYAIEVRHDRAGTPLELRQLSSGEKQIVSLFTHVYLGQAAGLTVLIDEPELSLSVPWQQKLLPDIRASKRCQFLAAVTHSPFIYDNELREHAVDLQQCIAER